MVAKAMRIEIAVAIGFLALPGCDGQDALRAEPSSASMFGDVDVVLTGNLDAIGPIRSVTIGGVRAVDVRPGMGAVTVHIQGAPSAGPAEIAITGDRGVLRNRSAFSFDAPAVP